MAVSGRVKRQHSTTYDRSSGLHIQNKFYVEFNDEPLVCKCVYLLTSYTSSTVYTIHKLAIIYYIYFNIFMVIRFLHTARSNKCKDLFGC